MERGFVSALAMNGAGIIHDFEIAIGGATSEDVDAALGAGQFGMAEETATELNRAINDGVGRGLGIGQAVGRYLVERQPLHGQHSLALTAARLEIPLTVHVAIGTDIIHMHPLASGAALGEGSLRDFRYLASSVAHLSGGVYINCGSAVILPEVFLKAVALARHRRPRSRRPDDRQYRLHQALSSDHQRRDAADRGHRPRLFACQPPRAPPSAPGRGAHRGGCVTQAETRAGERLAGRSWIVPLVAGLIGAATMTATLGPSLVDPTNVEWLMHHDYRLHHLGWHLYRHGPWTLPILGATPLLIWPIGSSIGLTDSMPIVALWLKALDPILPTDFQFIGLWLVLSFALQGVFGVLLMRLVTPRPALQLLGASLLILSPPLIFRILHAALTAHWLVLAALWLSLKPDAAAPSWRQCAAWALLLAASAATQPYIMFMILVLMLAAHLRQFIAAPRRVLRIAVHVAIVVGVGAPSVCGSRAASWCDRTRAWKWAGSARWSSNLSGVHHADGRAEACSGAARSFTRINGQYEGYAYLGAGVLLLAAIALGARLISRRRIDWTKLREYGPLILALAVPRSDGARPVHHVGLADDLPGTTSTGGDR